MDPEGGDRSGSSSDRVLVARVRGGDVVAFEALVRRHLAAAHQVASVILGPHRDEADDVVQEAFITALQRIDDCREPERFRAWLLMIVRNRGHNYRAYLQVRRCASLEEVPGVPAADDSSVAVEKSELRRDIEDAMGRLTELQRRVLRLHDLEGWRHAEIAAELGISPGGARFHLCVARRMMKKHLVTIHA